MALLTLPHPAAFHAFKDQLCLRKLCQASRLRAEAAETGVTEASCASWGCPQIAIHGRALCAGHILADLAQALFYSCPTCGEPGIANDRRPCPLPHPVASSPQNK
jgi:hypothetical protein